MTKLIYRWLVALCAVAVIVFTCRAEADAPTLTDRIAAVLLRQPRHHTDQDEDTLARETRLRDEAAAISSGVVHAACRGTWKDSPECRPVWRGSLVELTAALLAVRELESHGARYVVIDCKSGPGAAKCDDGKSRGMFQLSHQACPELWETEPGSADEARVGAFCAARVLGSAVRFCTDPGKPPNWEGAFSRYAVGSGCKWPGGAKRVRAMQRIAARL